MSNSESDLSGVTFGSAAARQRASAWLLALGVVGSAIALGAQHTWVLACVAVVMTASALLGWIGSEPARARPVATAVVVVATALTVFTALQCVPLPASLLAKIAPTNADTWARALLPLHEDGPAYAPISLDPSATRIQLLRGVTYLATFLAALRIARRREGTQFLERLLLVSCVVIAVAALLHPAFNAERVFGAYKPQSDFGRHIAPLLNANHLAGYVNIGIAVGLGMTIAPKAHVPRVAAAIVVVLLVAVECWVASRGGVLTMVMAIAIAGGMAFAVRGENARARVAPIALGCVVICATAVFVFAGVDQTWSEVANTDLSKLKLAKEALLVTRAFPWFGAGRGTFESVFPAFRTGTGYVTFTHPENLIAQWSVEWGAPIAIAAMLTLLVALRPKAALARTHVPIGAWVALACVGTQNLVDFSSEMPGVVIALTVCAALVVGGTAGGTSSRWVEQWSLRPNAVAGALVAAVVCALALTLPNVGRELHDDERTLRALALDPAVSRDAFHVAARAALLRHPAEPYLAYAGGLRALRARDESVVPWIERTLERAPVYGRAHLVLARALFSASPAQARLEYRTALDQDATLNLAKEASRLVTSYDSAMELVSDSRSGKDMLEVLTNTLGTRLPSTRYRLESELLLRSPEALAPLQHRAQDALADLRAEASAPWCDADHAACLKSALDATKKLEERQPDHCDPYALHANVLVTAGRVEEAIDELEASAAKVQERQQCLAQLVSIALASKRPARVDAALDRISRLACAEVEECVASFQYIANVELQRGNATTALAYLRKAHALDGERDDVTSEKASLAARLGLHVEAIEGYTALSRKHPENAQWKTALEEETRLRASTMPPSIRGGLKALHTDPQ